MPWQNNGGGDNPNPWGSGPRSGGGGRQEPPQIDDIIRKGQEQLKGMLPGGGSGVLLILVFLGVLWLASGFYKLESNEQAVILRFGKYSATTGAGLHWHMPYPIETREIRAVTNENTVEVGSRTQVTRGGTQRVSRQEESLMLTGDENIVDVKFNVVWRIKSLDKFLFNLRDPAQTVKVVSESAMRELVGRSQITPIITDGRRQLQQDAQDLVQNVLDSYESGVEVLRVEIQESQAPAEVIDAFLDVQRAKADKERARNEAQAYQNNIVPRALGQADKILQDAEAYSARTVARAEGEAARFSSVYEQYRLAKDVTRKRIYLETMEEILTGMDKIILDNQGGSGVVPYLPLDQLSRKGTKAGGQ